MTKFTLPDLKSLLPQWPVLLAWLVLIAVVVWSYSASLSMIVGVWCQQSDDYGHAFFVPGFAALLLWTRREMVRPMSLEACWENWGLALIGGILGMVSAGVTFAVFAPEQWSWYQPVLAVAYCGALGAALFQLGVLFPRNDASGKLFAVPGSLWGLAFLAVAALMRWASAYFFFQLLAPLALVPWVAGLTLFSGGWRAMRWAWPAIVFLLFMVPMPGFIHGISAQQLQSIGTKASVYTIQTLGIPAVAQENLIQLESGPLNVAEVCSGLRMLMLFFAVCVGAAFILQCELWEKIVIVLSAPPIAIFANVVRLTVTALASHLQWGEWFFELAHNWAGYLMMVLGILVLWGEISLLKRLILEPASKGPLSLGRPVVPGVRNPNS